MSLRGLYEHMVNRKAVVLHFEETPKLSGILNHLTKTKINIPNSSFITECKLSDMNHNKEYFYNIAIKYI